MYTVWAITASILIRAASVVYQRPPAFLEQKPTFWNGNPDKAIDTWRSWIVGIEHHLYTINLEPLCFWSCCLKITRMINLKNFRGIWIFTVANTWSQMQIIINCSLALMICRGEYWAETMILSFLWSFVLFAACNHMLIWLALLRVFGSVVAVVFQIAFRAEKHVNNVFLFFKNHFWYQHIKTIQKVQIAFNFNKKKKIEILQKTVWTAAPNSLYITLCKVVEVLNIQ